MNNTNLAEHILDRIFMCTEVVLPEIVAASEVQLLQHGYDWDEVELIAKCEFHIRDALVRSNRIIEAFFSQLEHGELERGNVKLVYTAPSGSKTAVGASLDELTKIARDDWDCS